MKYRLDHLMIESADPQAAAHRLAEVTGLPHAWPYMETPDYDSIGINFGSANVEFIRFRTRFGRPATPRAGLSGIAYELGAGDAAAWAHDTLEYRIGEEAPGHTTITLAESSVEPTVFLVQYRFDTAGWRARLRADHAACGGGHFGITGIARVAIPRLPDALAQLCDGLVGTVGDKPTLSFAASTQPDAAARDALQALFGTVQLDFTGDGAGRIRA